MLPFTPEDRLAIRASHVVETRCELRSALNGTVLTLPVEDGFLRWTLSSREGQRSGQVVVPGYDWFEAADPAGVTYARIVQTVKGAGTWDLGEFMVLRVSAVRPTGVVRLTLGDWAWRRDHPGAESTAMIGQFGQTVASVCQNYLDDVLPGLTVVRDDTNGATVPEAQMVPLGGSVWRALSDLCNLAGAYLMVTSRTTAEIRIFDGSAPVGYDLDGTVLGEDTAVLLDVAYNKAVVVIDGSDCTSARAEATITTGPYRYDAAGVGRLAVVQQMSLPHADQGQADLEAARLLNRRGGVVQSAELSVVGTPWLQIGDSVSWTSTTAKAPLRAVIDTILMPLDGRGAMDLVMRPWLVRN